MNSTEMQEKINAITERKNILKQKPWYRALEVVYSIAYVLGLLFVIVLSYSSGSFLTLVIGGLIFLGIFKAIKSASDYIFVGSIDTVRPEKQHMLNIDNSN